jgi:hypothetical protein
VAVNDHIIIIAILLFVCHYDVPSPSPSPSSRQ